MYIIVHMYFYIFTLNSLSWNLFLSSNDSCTFFRSSYRILGRLKVLPSNDGFWWIILYPSVLYHCIVHMTVGGTYYVTMHVIGCYRWDLAEDLQSISCSCGSCHENFIAPPAVLEHLYITVIMKSKTARNSGFFFAQPLQMSSPH